MYVCINNLTYQHMLTCSLPFVFPVLSGFYTIQLWMCEEGFKLNSEVKRIEDWKSWNFLSNFHPSYYRIRTCTSRIRVYFSVYSWRDKSRLTLCAEMQRFVWSMRLFFVTEQPNNFHMLVLCPKQCIFMVFKEITVIIKSMFSDNDQQRVNLY